MSSRSSNPSRGAGRRRRRSPYRRWRLPLRAQTAAVLARLDSIHRRNDSGDRPRHLDHLQCRRRSGAARRMRRGDGGVLRGRRAHDRFLADVRLVAAGDRLRPCEAGQPAGLFSADKVWTSGRRPGADRADRARYWGVPRFDLLQVHNLVAWQDHLKTAAIAMKAAGQLRYVGITTSEGRRHDLFEEIMRTEPLDFVQLTYNIVDREAEERLLPLARDRGIAVIVNRPFQQGDLTRAAGGRAAAGLGGGDRRRELGAVHPEVHPLASGRHGGDPGHQPRRPCAREPGRRRRSAAGRGDAPRAWRPMSGSSEPCREWWSYASRDFLLFSPRVYWRMFELHNEALWPLPLADARARRRDASSPSCVRGNRDGWSRSCSPFCGRSSAGASSGNATPPSIGRPSMRRRFSRSRRCSLLIVGGVLNRLSFESRGACRVDGSPAHRAGARLSAARALVRPALARRRVLRDRARSHRHCHARFPAHGTRPIHPSALSDPAALVPRQRVTLWAMADAQAWILALALAIVPLAHALAMARPISRIDR